MYILSYFDDAGNNAKVLTFCAKGFKHLCLPQKCYIKTNNDHRMHL